MQKTYGFMIALCAATDVFADQLWVPLFGAQVSDVLTDQRVEYAAAW